MRFRVLLEIDAPDVGTTTGDRGTVLDPTQWIWQDFFDKHGVTVKEAIITKPGFCGNCGERVVFFDYLCHSCRESALPGTAQYESPGK